MTDRNQRITECTRLDLHTEQRTHTARDNGRNGQQHIMLSGVTAPWRGVRAAADRHVAQPSRVEQLRHSSASYRRIVTWPSSPAARCSYSSRTRRARHGAPQRADLRRRRSKLSCPRSEYLRSWQQRSSKAFEASATSVGHARAPIDEARRARAVRAAHGRGVQATMRTRAGAGISPVPQWLTSRVCRPKRRCDFQTEVTEKVVGGLTVEPSPDAA